MRIDKRGRTVLTGNEARSGETGHGVRYVLLVSLLLTIMALATTLALARY